MIVVYKKRKHYQMTSRLLLNCERSTEHMAMLGAMTVAGPKYGEIFFFFEIFYDKNKVISEQP